MDSSTVFLKNRIKLLLFIIFRAFCLVCLAKALSIDASGSSRRCLMAWQCSASSNDGLVDNLVDARIISSSQVAEAMRRTDRGAYYNRCDRNGIIAAISGGGDYGAYTDAPEAIGFEATISAPHVQVRIFRQRKALIFVVVDGYHSHSHSRRRYNLRRRR